MRVLLTGANGFLGRHLKRGLETRGADVQVLSYRPLVSGERICNAVQHFQPEAIFNAGASQAGGDDPKALEELLASNIWLPAVLAWAVRSHAPACALICFGSSWQHGSCGELSPLNAYAASKSAGECMLDHYAIDGVRMASLRLYDTYGPGDNRNKLVNLLADSLLERSALDITRGDQLIDLVHVDDVVRVAIATAKALLASDVGTQFRYALRSDKPRQVINVLELMMDLCGLDAAPWIEIGARPYRPRERFELFSRTEAPPYETARRDLRSGLADLLRDRSSRLNYTRAINFAPKQS